MSSRGLSASPGVSLSPDFLARGLAPGLGAGTGAGADATGFLASALRDSSLAAGLFSRGFLASAWALGLESSLTGFSAALTGLTGDALDLAAGLAAALAAVLTGLAAGFLGAGLADFLAGAAREAAARAAGFLTGLADFLEWDALVTLERS